MKVGIVATHRQYIDHVAPVWAELAAAERGAFYVAPDVYDYARGLGLHEGPRSMKPDRWVVCSTRDLAAARTIARGRLVWMDHGTGLQWFPQGQLSRISNTVSLIAPPNDYLARRYAVTCPGVAVEVVGTPKMDRLLSLEHASDGATVALSFHWTSVSRSRVLTQYEPAVIDLMRRFRVLGHGHPHVWDKLDRWYERLGIERVRDFDDVVRRADVYACDHSSTIYEWAALGRPVVLLDHRLQHRNVQTSGLRYWDYADVGEHATRSDLPEVIAGVFAEDRRAPQREAATADLYPYLGRSAERAAEVLRGMG